MTLVAPILALFCMAISSNYQKKVQKKQPSILFMTEGDWFEKGVHNFRHSDDLQEFVPPDFTSNYGAGIKAERNKCRKLARTDAEHDYERVYRYPGEHYKKNYDEVWAAVEDEKKDMTERGERYGFKKTIFEEDILIVNGVNPSLLETLRSVPFKKWYFKQGVIAGSRVYYL